MRKYILLLCALCAGLVSCVKEDFVGADVDGLVTFTASYEAQTKTVLNGLTPYWTAQEKISIFNGVNNEFAADVSEPSGKATFKGKLEGKGTKNFRAVSPYSADYTFSSLGSTFYGLSVPKEQSAVESSYDPQALVAIAQSDDYNLSFKNLVSLVKFTVISEGVTSVTLRSSNEEVLSGKFEATYSASPSIRVREGHDDVTIKGDFKSGFTYYIVTLPATLENGFIVLLNGSVKALSIDEPVQLTRSGMVNLGELSLNPGESQLPGGDDEEDEATPSEWALLGEHNSWNDAEPTPMYEVGSNFVAFDVPAAVSAGFKFKKGDTWVGTASSVALDKWVPAQDGDAGQNITFTGTATSYDIYFATDLKAFYITAAGNPSPAPQPKPHTGITVAGTFNGWATAADPAEEEGDYYTLKCIKAAMVNSTDPTGGDKGFKFVYTDEKGTQTWYGAQSATVNVSQWYNANSDGAAPNIYVNGDASADYDVYLSKDRKTFCVVPTGAELPDVDSGTTTPDTPSGDQGGSYRFTVKVNKSIDWYDKYLYTWENGQPTLGSWPGVKMNWDKEDGNYYVYYYDFPADWSGRTINYIISSGSGGQTNDLAVTLSGSAITVIIEQSDVK